MVDVEENRKRTTPWAIALPTLRRIALLALIAASACRSGGGIQVLPQDTGIDAERAFREWAAESADFVEIEAFEESGRRQEDVEDRFRGVLRLFIVEARVDVRYLRDFATYDAAQSMDRMLAPGGSVSRAMRESRLGRIFETGTHERGDRQTVEVSILFETAGAGWRFLTVDHLLQLNCPRGIG